MTTSTVLLCFDECHKEKNCVAIGSTEPTKTGLAVLELQNKLPNARIVYVTVTGASEPRHLGYMVRMGLWGQGTPFDGKKWSELAATRSLGIFTPFDIHLLPCVLHFLLVFRADWYVLWCKLCVCVCPVTRRARHDISLLDIFRLVPPVTLLAAIACPHRFTLCLCHSCCDLELTSFELPRTV
jgi:hypothetical protein